MLSRTEGQYHQAPVSQAPCGRKMHGAACLLPWAPLLVIYGGWKAGPQFDDLWICGLGGTPADLDAFATFSEGPMSEGSAGEEGNSELFNSDEGHHLPMPFRGYDAQVQIAHLL